MKCVHIASGDLWAGAEVSAFHTVVELSRRGGVDVCAVVLNPGELAERLTRSGVPTWVVPERGRGFSRVVGECLRRVRPLRPGVIHTHRYKEHVIGSVLSLSSGARHVRSVHGLNPILGADWGARAVGSLLDGALADWMGSDWVVVSSDLARTIAGLRRRIWVVPNGLPPQPPDPDRRTLDGRCGAGAGEWAVGFVGRLEWIKRPDRFLRVLALLPTEAGGRAVRGIVLGSGSMEADLRDLAARLGVRHRVSFLGNVPEGDRLLAALDVLVLPSDHEGHPMVLLEAMRSGVPVVASAVGGVAEAAGESDWIVPPEDESGMAARIRILLESSDARRRWSAELRRRFLERYTVGRTVDRLLDVYGAG